MSNQDLYNKYVKEVCSKCKNKKCNLCKITIREDNHKREARCDNYEQA